MILIGLKAKLESQISILISLMKQIINNQSNGDLLTQKNLLELLQISPNTLKKWENKGLQRLEPPIEGTRTVYYKLSDVISFLEN